MQGRALTSSLCCAAGESSRNAVGMVSASSPAGPAAEHSPGVVPVAAGRSDGAHRGRSADAVAPAAASWAAKKPLLAVEPESIHDDQGSVEQSPAGRPYSYLWLSTWALGMYTNCLYIGAYRLRAVLIACFGTPFCVGPGTVLMQLSMLLTGALLGVADDASSAATPTVEVLHRSCPEVDASVETGSILGKAAKPAAVVPVQHSAFPAAAPSAPALASLAGLSYGPLPAIHFRRTVHFQGWSRLSCCMP